MNFLKNSFNTVTNAVEINKLKDKLHDLEKQKHEIEMEKNNNNLQINQKEIMMSEISKLFTASKDNLNVLDGVVFNKTDFNCEFEIFIQKYQSKPELFLFKKLYDNLKKNNEIINDVMNYYNNNVKSSEYYDEKLQNVEKNIEDTKKKLNAVRVKQFGKKENKSSADVVVEELN